MKTRLLFSVGSAIAAVGCMGATALGAALEAPRTTFPVEIRMPTPADAADSEATRARLRGPSGVDCELQAVPAFDDEGRVATGKRWWVGTLPPGEAGRVFRFEGVAAAGNAGEESRFRMESVDDKSLGVWEGDKPVLVYNHGLMLKEGVPADRARSSYIHPLYDLDGGALTDDFPEDHHHHRGLFWAWPHVRVGNRGERDLWMLKGIAHRFERWLAREAGPQAAVLGIENSWVASGETVMTERVWVTMHRATEEGRAIDLDFVWIPTLAPVSLAGAEGKSYGGLTLRFAPQKDAVITTPLGNKSEDLYMTRLEWADLSARFRGEEPARGAAIFVGPDHPACCASAGRACRRRRFPWGSPFGAVTACGRIGRFRMGRRWAGAMRSTR
jgi:hypothetical protein